MCSAEPGAGRLLLAWWEALALVPMSWSELERLVDQAEANPSLRRTLKGCRSTPELILAARRLGYRITRIDLQRAWEEERQEYQREAQG